MTCGIAIKFHDSELERARTALHDPRDFYNNIHNNYSATAGPRLAGCMGPGIIKASFSRFNSLSDKEIYLTMAEQASGTLVPPTLEQIITENNCDMDSVFSKDKLSILVCGRTGLGKSELINTLAGAELSEVKDPGDVDFNLVHQTIGLKEQHITLHGKVVSIWDSPGLQDETGRDQEYVDNMYDHCSDVDLILYCVDMTITRWTNQEINAIKIITEKFEGEFWKKTILVLTKANAVKLVKQTQKEDPFSYHKTLFNNLLRIFKQTLIKLGVSNDIVENIPAVAVGYIDVNGDDKDFDDRYIWYTSNKAHGYTTGDECSDESYKGKERTDFLPEVWVTCLERVSVESRDTFWNIARGDNVKLAESVPEECIKLFEEQKQEMKIIEAEYQQEVYNGPEQEDIPVGDPMKVKEAMPPTPKMKLYKDTTRIVLNLHHENRTRKAIAEANEHKRSWLKQLKQRLRKFFKKKGK